MVFSEELLCVVLSQRKYFQHNDLLFEIYVAGFFIKSYVHSEQMFHKLAYVHKVSGNFWRNETGHTVQLRFNKLVKLG